LIAKSIQLVAASVCAIAFLAFAFAGPAHAETSIYHPEAGSRNFNNGPGGWTGSDSAGGPCAVPLVCPSVTNSYQANGGSGGGGYLRSEFGGLLGVAGERSAIWTSPPFAYRGAKNQFPDELSFDLDRRADVDALLSVTGNEAEFTAELVDAETGTAVTTAATAPLEGAPDWSAIPTADVNPNQLEIGKAYFIRIISRIEFGADVLPGSTADYDNVVLTATVDNTGPSCSGIILGTKNDDNLTGSNGGERIKSFKGKDKVFGLRGGDCLYGGPDNDRLTGMIGPDTVNGNTGVDFLRGGPGKDSLNGGEGDDKLRGVAGNDTMKGGAGDDDISGAAGADVANGSGGDDAVKGGAGPDKLKGGGGKDVINGFADGDSLRGGGGADTIRSGGDRDNVTGGGGKDTISTGAGRDIIKSRGGGVDRVKCGGGKDGVLADRRDKVGPSCEKVKLRK
jgi:Ca2+-binding RTX toxin-like protein